MRHYIGALFAGGHCAVVLSLAAVAGWLGVRMTMHGAAIEIAGTWASIAMLFLIGAVNVWRLLIGRGSADATGLKTALLPRRLRAARDPLIAIPLGMLFGLGFDTASQVVAYTLAFTNGGIAGALIVGFTFSAGMAITDTLDSLLVCKLYARPAAEASRVRKLWMLTVTAFAFLVGGYELAQTIGWRSSLPDLAVSAALVGGLFAVFGFSRAYGSGVNPNCCTRDRRPAASASAPAR
jgi:high-affinity nickel-transport protein